MDQQKLFLSSNIFDIDSALDRLEENLLNDNHGKSPIDKGSLQQINDSFVVKNIPVALSNAKISKESGYLTEKSDCIHQAECKNEISAHNEYSEKATPSKTFDISNGDSSDEDKRFEPIVPNSSSFESSSSIDVPGNSFHIENASSGVANNSLKELVDNPSIEHITEEQTVCFDDIPATVDLTLTKTVELTENDNDFSIEPEDEKCAILSCISEQRKQVANPEKPELLDVVRDVSQVNFESTMDDISDAELESLEQELEDLVDTPETEKVIKSKSEDGHQEHQNKENSSQILTKKDPEIDQVLEPYTDEETRNIETTEDQCEIENSEKSLEKPTNSGADSSTDESTSVQNLPSQTNEELSVNESNSTGSLTSAPDLGRVQPYWIPDNMTNQCMQCDAKFTLIKRRHHCRACGLLLCSTCCSERFFLHYLGGDGRICGGCKETLEKAQQQLQDRPRNPNPSNPMEYCSTLPPQLQVNTSSIQPPMVMVPTGVLKRGPRSSERKSVIFSDGIRPGTDLEASREVNSSFEKSRPTTTPIINVRNNSFIPDNENELPPILRKNVEYLYVENNLQLLQRLRQEEIKFAINKNFSVIVKIVILSCCTNKTVINFATVGLLAVCQDELLILLELCDAMEHIPKEVFLHLNEIYTRAQNENVTIKEYGYSQASTNNFLGAFGGFLYIRPSFQCQQSLLIPQNPYLIGILVHKWEIPWMRLFPLRLILRLGALYRYYPTPIMSNIYREPVYAEIGNTVMNFLADFRNFTYTIDIVKGLIIHMEERKTSVFVPKNRYDQIMKILNSSTDHFLAFGADFSKTADGHLVCIQNIESGSTESLSYSTQAINIQGQTRTRTGASFLILNEGLKSSSGLKAKCSIVEDGLMIQISSTKMQNVRNALRNMKNVDIACGPIEIDGKDLEENVSIEWIPDDLVTNVGVLSPVDGQSLEGKENIRTRLDFSSPTHSKILRWSEVFILETNWNGGNFIDDNQTYLKLSENIAKASGTALLSFLDLLYSSELNKIGIRVTIGENIKYSAGSNGTLLSSMYMNALDDELIGAIHKQASCLHRSDSNLTFELIFFVLNK